MENEDQFVRAEEILVRACQMVEQVNLCLDLSGLAPLIQLGVLMKCIEISLSDVVEIESAICDMEYRFEHVKRTLRRDRDRDRNRSHPVEPIPDTP
jgi:hypothetical protein